MSTMINPWQHALRHNLPITELVSERLAEGYSIVLSSPRYFCSEQLALCAVVKAFGQVCDRRIVRLNAIRNSLNGDLDFEALWLETKRQLEITSEREVASANDYVRSMNAYFNQCGPSLTLFVLRGGDRTTAVTYRQLLDTIHQLVDYQDSTDVAAKRLFVAIDDYSLHYLIQDSDLRSEWFCARWLYLDHLSRQQLSDFFQLRLNHGGDSYQHVGDRFVDLLFEHTDGHIGLISEFFDAAWSRHKDPVALLIESDALASKALFTKSPLLERMRAAISDDSTGLCATAMDHLELEMPAEYQSPRIQVLRQLGVLRWENAYEARMCRGVIGDMVKAIARQKNKARLGTVTGMAGISRFESEEFIANDSDIVVLHVSDLHFGQDFAYKLMSGGQVINESGSDIVELLQKDVERINLAGRVDALVISGDIACTAASAEYSRALDVLGDLALRLGVDKSGIVIVPGNHDLQWDPDIFARRQSGRNVSREEFEKFFFSLCGRKLGPADMVRLVSRDGQFGLRIIGLDSNEVEGREAAGIGFVGEDCLREAKRLMTTQYDVNATAIWRTWFVLHHHINAVTSCPLSDAMRRGVSVLANTPTILAHVRDFEVEAILHGHEHQPAVTELKWWLGERGSVFGRVAVVCAGSLSARRERLGPVARNHYMVLIRRPDELIVRSRIMGDEGLAFRSHEDLSLSLSRKVDTNWRP